MIQLNDYRANIFQNEGVKECPHYSEDGVIKKIFETIGVGRHPFIIEFGETRSLGTTTRSFRIIYRSRALYFTGNISKTSRKLNFRDILRIVSRRKDARYLKFLFNQPFEFFVTPDNVIELFRRKKVKDIDILTIDIDSYDYFIAREILEKGFRPRLLILEYNFNLGYSEAISYPYPPVDNTSNRRAFGASFKAMNGLATGFGYKLVHVSGFCNLFFIRQDYAGLFETPDLDQELMRSSEDVLNFINKYCQKGFIPSWFNEPPLKDADLAGFKQVN